jgi:hypothetical protein
MERTQSHKVDSAAAERHELGHHIHYVGGVEYLLYGKLVYHPADWYIDAKVTKNPRFREHCRALACFLNNIDSYLHGIRRKIIYFVA